MALKSPFEDGPCVVKVMRTDASSAWEELLSESLDTGSTSSDFTYLAYSSSETTTARIRITADNLVQFDADDGDEGAGRMPTDFGPMAVRIIPDTGSSASSITGTYAYSGDLSNVVSLYGAWPPAGDSVVADLYAPQDPDPLDGSSITPFNEWVVLIGGGG